MISTENSRRSLVALEVIVYHLLTESEVITGKSQTEALMYQVNKLFIIWPFFWSVWPVQFVLWMIKLALAVALFVAHTKEISVC